MTDILLACILFVLVIDYLERSKAIYRIIKSIKRKFTK